jgi:hypothetical protein
MRKSFVNAREEVVVKTSREVLFCDEASVAVIAHEMHELNGLRGCSRCPRRYLPRALVDGIVARMRSASVKVEAM